MLRARFQKRQMPDVVKGFVLDGGLPAALGLILFKLYYFIHDELPVPRGDLRIHSRLLLRFLARMEQPQGCGTVSRAQAVLFARRVIVDVVTSSVFSPIESVSLSHSCVHSDEVTTIDLDSRKEQVGVTQGGPELNRAGTSAGTHRWKFPKPFSSNRLGLEAR